MAKVLYTNKYLEFRGQKQLCWNQVVGMLFNFNVYF